MQIFAPADLINVSCANLLKFAVVFSRFCIIAQFYEFETQMLSVEQFPFNAHADRRLVRILAILINPATLFEKFHLNCHKPQAHHLRRKRRSRVVRCHYCQHRQIRLQPKCEKILKLFGFSFHHISKRFIVINCEERNLRGVRRRFFSNFAASSRTLSSR